MSLYDFVSTICDKRLPRFVGSGTRRSGNQVHFGKGQGKFFLGHTLSLTRVNGKWVANNTPYILQIKEQA